MKALARGLWSVMLLTLAVAAGAAELTLEEVRRVLPEADAIGAPEAEVPAVPAYRDRTLIGYAYVTTDLVRIPAYSGRPISTLVGLDLQARITGLTILAHEEPILVLGISDADLQRFIDQYRGLAVTDAIKIGGTAQAAEHALDSISGATITIMVLNASITRSARQIAAALGLPKAAAPEAPRQAAAAPAPGKGPPVWMEVWEQKTVRIAVLGVGLLTLLVILFTQDWLARYPTLLLYVRTAYLAFTLFFIGWFALAQLSIVNVMTFVQSLIHDFSWESFLIDPMLFILWSFVAMTLLLWGRGVFCGWLCPFGALQELGFRLAKRLKIPSYELPDVVHERLWALKYIILLVLFGLSLHSLTAMERAAEVEPFKTAITLRFQREWLFVLYAGALLATGLFIRKFFCRYVCPLGAALTVAGRFRIFDWLRRRKECGRPCQICAQECEVRCITPTGEINMNECHYCMDCQVTYYNAFKCPPLAEKRKRREKAALGRQATRSVEVALEPSAARGNKPRG